MRVWIIVRRRRQLQLLCVAVFTSCNDVVCGMMHGAWEVQRLATVDLGTAHLNNASRWSRKSNIVSHPFHTPPPSRLLPHAVLKIVSITDDNLVEKANLRMGSKKANLNYSVVDVKWNPDPGE